jgi:hypothetical protein
MSLNANYYGAKSVPFTPDPFSDPSSKRLVSWQRLRPARAILLYN